LAAPDPEVSARQLKTIELVAIAIICMIGILSAVFVFGGAYQQELFEEYLENSQSPRQKPQNVQDLPTFKIP
ncbi:MAG: hypothetical protein P8X83_05790, partial [Nitrosopumilaceae archaeon]